MRTNNAIATIAQTTVADLDMSPKHTRTLHSYTRKMNGKSHNALDTYKFFQDSVTKDTVAATLKEAFDYCQATFNLTPLGNQVAKRDVREVKDKAMHSKAL